MNARNFLSSEDQKKVVFAIQEAELNTSGEIRLHIDNKCGGDPYQKAIALFSKLKMTETKDRNGVLIYISVEDRKIAIVGDKGINESVPEGFWIQHINKLTVRFAKKEFSMGLQECILEVGKRLKQFFPYQTDDVNELSNDISFDD